MMARPSLVRVMVCRATPGALAANETGAEIWGTNPVRGFKVNKVDVVVRLVVGPAAIATVVPA